MCMAMNTSASNYFLNGCGRCALGGTSDCKVHTWASELALLRAIINDSELVETAKWGVPCYTYAGRNVLMLTSFKGYCCISFFKGVLLRDEQQLLQKPGPNVQAGRLLAFTSTDAIRSLTPAIEAYISEAIAVEQAGLQLPPTEDLPTMPLELLGIFEEDPVFKNAFEALTPGRQRGYILHFSQPKQTKTRIARIEKYKPLILSGIGLHDQYKANR